MIIVKDQRPHEGRINSKFKGQGFASPTMKVNHSLAWRGSLPPDHRPDTGEVTGARVSTMD